ncbi:MAG: stage II sporulation protein R [Clostridiales bacterium]|jgi:stage II sporulation protein R|nr:stage II sporulation protein R [Clostridiales bacterium]
MFTGKIKVWYKKERKIIIASLVLGFIITLSAAFYSKAYSDRVVSNISEEVIRFHVLANSDSKSDQTLKIKVKDAVINEYESLLNSSKSIEETRGILINNIEGISQTAESVITGEGYNYPVKVSMSEDKFPTKVYGDITLPAGRYEALRIEIGEAKGQNWWCVMFPPLCYVDVTKAETEPSMKEALKNNLSEDEYRLVDNSYAQEDKSIEVKFKIVEFWQELTEEEEADEIITVENKTESEKDIETVIIGQS